MTRKNALLRLTSRLIARRDALRKTLNGDLDTFRTVSETNGVGDHVDSANLEICSRLVEIESRELGQIEHALQRIAAGVYGRCEFCGGKVSATRLNALPYANSCITCQRQNERRGPSRALDPDSKRWAKVFEDSIEEGENAAPIDLGDFEIDFSESGRRSLDSLLV